MSLPFSVIYCDSCDYEGSSTCLWGDFHYEDEDGRRGRVDRQLGWCRDCEGVVPVERIPPLSDLAAPDAGAGPGLAARLRARWRRLFEREWERERREEKRIAGELIYRIATSGREPVCLVCGSRRASPFAPFASLSPGPRGDYYDLDLRFGHPVCGGALRVRNSEYRIALEMPERVYDLNGQPTVEFAEPKLRARSSLRFRRAPPG